MSADIESKSMMNTQVITNTFVMNKTVKSFSAAALEFLPRLVLLCSCSAAYIPSSK